MQQGRRSPAERELLDTLAAIERRAARALTALHDGGATNGAAALTAIRTAAADARRHAGADVPRRPMTPDAAAGAFQNAAVAAMIGR